MKKISVVVLLLILSVAMFANETKIDLEVANINQLGRAPQSNSNAILKNNFTLDPNNDPSRYNYDVYTGNTTGSTYNAVDLATGALTPTGSIGSDPFPMAEEYDGTSIYRVYSDLSFVEVNPDDGLTTALGTISGVAGTPTGLAYKWDTSTMYIVILDGGNAPHFCTLDLNTLVATEIGIGTGMVIAMDFADDGYLYTPSIDDDNLYQVDPATGISTLIGSIGYNLNYGQDVTYDYITNQLYTISCGGAYILGTYNLSTGALTQIADMGGQQHAVLVSTIASACPEAPAAPSDLVVTPDAGGALSCELTWVNPDLTFGGDPLTELLETRVYRDGDLIYTNSNPGIGDPDNYTDAPTASGLYNYGVTAYNSAGESPAASYVTWVGEDVPAAVEDLLLEEQSGNGYLTWVNPTVGLNGGAFNNPILGYHIVRSDGVVFEITGENDHYTDITIPGADYYDYTVTVYNSIGDGGSATSNTVMIGAGDEIFFDDFEAGLGNWNSIINSGAGSWIVYSPPFPNNYNMPPTSSGNVCSADSDAAGSGTTTDCTIELVTTLDLTNYTTVNLQFDNDFNAIDADDYCYVDVTTDGTTWDNVLTFSGVDVTATHEIIDITAFVVGHSSVNIRFHSVQPGWDWWWTIDNVGVYGTGIPADPGYIEGTVVIADGAGDVEDVEVEAGGVIVNPLANGTYSIELDPGTYDVTASLDGYDTEIIEDVLVTESNATTGVDFSLVTDGDEIILAATKLNGNYPNPFNPVTTIAYSIKDAGNVTLEVYNLRGQLVKSLVNEVIETGDHIVTWKGRDNSNKSVASGVYFYKMKAQNYSSIKKMILMK